MLTVSVPSWQTPPELLHRALWSLLGQTVEDLAVVLVADGEPVDLPRVLSRHPRLIVFQSDTNRGRYWCDAVVSAAAPPGWFAVHDADDWSEPDRFARLLDVAAGTGAALAPYWTHQLDGGTSLRPPVLHRPDGQMRHLGHWCSGVYSTDRIAEAGGIHPGFRVGFDTLHTGLLQLCGPISIDPTPGYHWQRRHGSLSTHRDTGQGSKHREDTRRRLRRLYRRAYDAARAGHDIGAVVRDDIPAGLAAEVARHAEVLRRELCSTPTTSC